MFVTLTVEHGAEQKTLKQTTTTTHPNKNSQHITPKQQIPIFGLIANMAFHQCCNCGNKEHVFGEDGAENYAKELSVDLLG